MRGGEGAGAGDRVFQLADVARPVVGLQGGDGFRGNADARHAVLAGDPLEEIFGQQRECPPAARAARGS